MENGNKFSLINILSISNKKNQNPKKGKKGGD
jgi:hypothetical protein